MSKSSISHQGIIESITTDIIKVRIINLSACASCHAKGACNASDMSEKIIDAIPNTNTYKIGDPVTIIGKESMGFKALFLGYLIPLLLVLIVLIIGTTLGIAEAKAGLFALAALIPYYGVLFLLKDKIKKSFIFEIKQ